MSITRGDEQAGAIFSPCGKFRYALWRQITNQDPPTDCVWIGLNPSTADHIKLDNTTRRCLTWSREWGCTRYVMLNAYGFRSTNPRGMKVQGDPIGLENDEHLLRFTRDAKIIVAAWGGNVAPDRQQAVCRAIGKRLMCLGVNQDGTPKHPLYVAQATQRVVFWEPQGCNQRSHERT